MARPRPAVQKAATFIQQYIAKNKLGPAEKLPGAAELSRLAGVSHVSILKAIGHLKSTGTLYTRPGYGTLVGPLSSEPKESQTPPTLDDMTRSDVILSMFRRDIVRGVYTTRSRLPSSKELQEHYGVCYRTLQKVLGQLCREGFLQPYKRHYRIPDSHRRSSGGTVVLVARGRFVDGLELIPKRSMILLKETENVCMLNGLTLKILLYDFDGATLVPNDKTLLDSNDRSILGYLYWTIGTVDPLTIAYKLVETDKPVAILDETVVDFGPLIRSTRPIRFFSMATSPLCGNAVGRYLLTSGYERCLYIDNGDGTHWSANRLAGLRKVFMEGGLPDAVDAVSLPPLDFDLLQLPDLHQLFNPDLPDGELDLLFNMYKLYGDAFRRRILGHRRHQHSLPVLKRALSMHARAVWVACNDNVGETCLDFLRSRNIRVPEEIAVIGFDDLDEASFRQLSSYNFNYGAVAQNMLTAITAPNGPCFPRGGKKKIEIEGFVNQRTTC